MRLYRRLPGRARCARAGSRSPSRSRSSPRRSAALRFVPQQFFPPSDRVELLVDLEPAAERLDLRDRERRRAARRDPRRGPGRRALEQLRRARRDPLLPAARRPARESVLRPGRSCSRRTSRRASGCRTRLEQVLAEQFPNVVARVSPLELGPPVGWPVQYRVSGPDPTELRAIALRLADAVASDAATRRINFDWMEPAREVRIAGRPGRGAPARARLGGGGRRC